MKSLLMVAALGAGLLSVAPAANAQGVAVGVGPGGVEFGVPDRERYHERRYVRERHYYRDDDPDYRDHDRHGDRVIIHEHRRHDRDDD